MYVWGNIHTLETRGMYVCQRYRKLQGMYVCLGKHTYSENYRYVCMSGKHTYLETIGMYVCLGKHTYLEIYRYVCMSGETYIPRNYRYVCMIKVCMCVWEIYRYVCLRSPRGVGAAPSPAPPLPRFMSDTPHRCCMFVTTQTHLEKRTCV